MFAQPQSRTALVELISDCARWGVPYCLMGRGSNLLIASRQVDGLVIRATEACRELHISEHTVRVGASVPLQKLLTTAANVELSGLEYLHSVPGNVGGAVFMNAGRGRSWNRAIGDHVVEVEFFDGRRVRRIARRQCRFSYRTSIFQTLPKAVILSCTLRLDKCRKEEAFERLRARIREVKCSQDNSEPNAGSVFREGFTLARNMMGLERGQARFSSKTPNWILHRGGNMPDDVLELLETARSRHLNENLPPPVLEWTVW